MRSSLKNIYNKLYSHFGPQHWWPAKTTFEVMVGAILTQNTAWPNVERAIKNLKKEKLLSPRKINDVSLRKLGSVIKPSGFYNEKAKKLKNFVKFLLKHGTANIRREDLLGVKGIGPETADSILLYALGKPVFVVDAYTRRVFARHKLIPEDASYEQIQAFFMKNLSNSTRLFNEYHALIVKVGKNYCRKNKPLCEICPLKSI